MLSAGTRIEQYEVIALLGAGGMGEVYRARDTRIGREVAIKILPTIRRDQDSMIRFEQEARAAGMINHPNILTVFDTGTYDGAPFLVSELLEGMSLREALRSRIPARRALEYAAQLAAGLTAAHEKGLVHRDVKPENAFVLDDGRVKLLDFGLVKLLRNESPSASDDTARMITDPGMVMGTVGYMSPEQVRGEEVDHRSDIFSLGVVLYEMLTGQQPFRRSTAVETMNAILHDEPVMGPEVSGSIARLVEHAMEKRAAHRFQSARDLGFALASISESGTSAVPATRSPRRKSEKAAPLRYHRVTFRPGFVMSARFAPDGSVVYGAAWQECPLEVFSSILATPESRSILPGADVLSVASSGELAVSLGRHYLGGYVTLGTLARVPLAGGVPRLICEGVQDARWTKDGRDFLIIRRAADGLYRIESPIDQVIYQTPLWISAACFSPDEQLIAFFEHRVWGDDGGTLVVIDRNGQQVLRGAQQWSSTGGMAWTPKGDEVWVAADTGGGGRELVATTLAGKQRIVLSFPGRMTIQDIAPDGRVLVVVESGRREIVAGRRGEGGERNLSWFDWSWLSAIGRRGSFVLIEEQAAAARGRHLLYIRGTDGTPAVRIGDGRARGHAISPDERWIAAMTEDERMLQLLPVGAGQPRNVPCSKLNHSLWWQFTPDARRLVILGNFPGEPMRLFEVALDGDGTPRPITSDPVGWPCALSADGRWVAATSADQRIILYSTERDESRPAPGCTTSDVPMEWSDDSRALFVYERGRTSVSVFRIDMTTGAREHWLTIRPPDPAGIMDIMPVCITPDGQSYAYGYRRFLGDVYVVTGLL